MQPQWTNNKDRTVAMDHQFDNTLRTTHGDVSVIMRISEDQILLNKVLSLFKGLANEINMSIHGIKQ